MFFKKEKEKLLFVLLPPSWKIKLLCEYNTQHVLNYVIISSEQVFMNDHQKISTWLTLSILKNVLKTPI